MSHLGNDQWTGSFIVEKQGYYTYLVEGWVDYALNWQHGTERKIQDKQQVKSELLEGAEYIKAVRKMADASEKDYLKSLEKYFASGNDYDKAVKEAMSRQLTDIFLKYPTKFLANESRELQVYVDRQKALFSTWYEFFPRSASAASRLHPRDCQTLA